MSSTGGLSVEVQGGDNLDRAVAALQDGRDEMAERIGEVIHDLAEDRAKSAAIRVLLEPVRGFKSTGLREQVASGVSVRDISGGSQVITSMPKDDEAAIPRGFDPAVSFRPMPGTWRHPLFGNDSRWYRNVNGAFSWFIGAFEGADVDGANRLTDMLEEVAEGIAGQIGD